MSIDTQIAEIQLVLPPEAEERRLRSLDQLQILDSPPEDRFERVTRMARLVFGVPMASVALLDRDRLWFKMVEGLPLSEVPRAETVCQTTVARTYTEPADPALIVDDLARVPEFARLPGVGGDGGVRFYAGYPCTVRVINRSERSASTTPHPGTSTTHSRRHSANWLLGHNANSSVPTIWSARPPSNGSCYPPRCVGWTGIRCGRCVRPPMPSAATSTITTSPVTAWCSRSRT